MIPLIKEESTKNNEHNYKFQLPPASSKMADERKLSKDEDEKPFMRNSGTKYIKEIMRSQIDDQNNSRSLSELNDLVPELQHTMYPINIQK